MTNEDLSAFQIAEAKEAQRRERWVSLLENSKRFVEAFCTPERLVNHALSKLTVIGPFNYEILEVRYLNTPISTPSDDGKSLRLEPARIPVSVIIRDRLDKNLVFALTITVGEADLIAREISRGATRPPSDNVTKLKDDSIEAFREAHEFYDPYGRLDGFSFELDVVEWKSEAQIASSELKPLSKRYKVSVNSRTKWKHWHPINSTPIRSFDELKRAIEACPSNPAQGFFNQNTVSV